MFVGRSKTGLPTICESGGGASNTGSAQVIADANGQPVNPLFVPRGYSNGEHAIFVAQIGMLIVSAKHSRRGESIDIHRIAGIGTEGNPDELKVELVAGWENNDGNIPAKWQTAADAALEKAHCYHCRSAFFIA